MENSGKFLFEDDSAQWFVAMGEKGVGPLTASDVYQKILSQQITWGHFIWKKGQGDWKRICDVKTFQAVAPNQPAKEVQKQVKEATKTGIQVPSKKTAGAAKAVPSDQSRWFLHYNETQYGPFSTAEIQGFVQTRRIHGQVFTWKEGMANWDRLEKIPEFQALFSKPATTPPPAPAGASSKGSSAAKAESSAHGKLEAIQAPIAQAKADQRSTPRRPLIAKILMSDDQSVIVGVCRDISIGGLQVLTERIPAEVGSKLKMNISPSSNETGKKIEPFVAEGVIVRILEDGRGFSFRFSKLTEPSRNAIESYIESPL